MADRVDREDGRNGHSVRNGHSGRNGRSGRIGRNRQHVQSRQNGQNGQSRQNGQNGQNGQSRQNGQNGQNRHADVDGDESSSDEQRRDPDPWQDTNPTTRMLIEAEENGYSVVAAMVYNQEGIAACIRAAERKRAPLIMQFPPWALTHNKGELINVAAEEAMEATVMIAVHLHRCQNEDLMRETMEDLPLDSVMVDMSHHSLEENLTRTRDLVSEYHDYHIATEAAPGPFLSAGQAGLTTGQLVERFIATGIDIFAPVFGLGLGLGLGHGHADTDDPDPGPVIDYERLRMIRRTIDGRARLALHGSECFPESVVRNCIRGGVSKINLDTLGPDEDADYLTRDGSSLETAALHEETVRKMQTLIEKQIDVSGSAGKGDKFRYNAHPWMGPFFGSASQE